MRRQRLRFSAPVILLAFVATSCAGIQKSFRENPKAMLGGVLGAGAGAGIAAAAQRAANVAGVLTSQGITASRLVTQGFGEQYPAAPNATTTGRRNNRRVEVTVR